MTATAAHRMIAAGFESRDALLKLINTEPQLMVELTGLGEMRYDYS